MSLILEILWVESKESSRDFEQTVGFEMLNVVLVTEYAEIEDEDLLKEFEEDKDLIAEERVKEVSTW